MSARIENGLAHTEGQTQEVDPFAHLKPIRTPRIMDELAAELAAEDHALIFGDSEWFTGQDNTVKVEQPRFPRAAALARRRRHIGEFAMAIRELKSRWFGAPTTAPTPTIEHAPVQQTAEIRKRIGGIATARERRSLWCFGAPEAKQHSIITHTTGNIIESRLKALDDIRIARQQAEAARHAALTTTEVTAPIPTVDVTDIIVMPTPSRGTMRATEVPVYDPQNIQPYPRSFVAIPVHDIFPQTANLHTRCLLAGEQVLLSGNTARVTDEPLPSELLNNQDEFLRAV